VLARKFARVKALDISLPHLDIARRVVDEIGQSNVEFVHTSKIESLAALDSADLFYSCIVLQHNPPPVIFEILTRALAGLKPGGFAFFQLPTYGAGYVFDLEAYIARLAAGGSEGMEMHILPQETVFRIIADQGCVALEVQPDYCCGSYDTWVSNSFFVEKRK
jgi:SAM-dependent methyltransferase